MPCVRWLRRRALYWWGRRRARAAAVWLHVRRVSWSTTTWSDEKIARAAPADQRRDHRCGAKGSLRRRRWSLLTQLKRDNSGFCRSNAASIPHSHDQLRNHKTAGQAPVAELGRSDVA